VVVLLLLLSSLWRPHLDAASCSAGLPDGGEPEVTQLAATAGQDDVTAISSKSGSSKLLLLHIRAKPEATHS
jgi:hypothetical protein